MSLPTAPQSLPQGFAPVAARPVRGNGYRGNADDRPIWPTGPYIASVFAQYARNGRSGGEALVKPMRLFASVDELPLRSAIRADHI